MLRKQKEFAFRQYRYDAIEPAFSAAAVNKLINEMYLDQGWEVLTANVVRAEANSVFVGIFFVKYEDAEEVKTKKA